MPPPPVDHKVKVCFTYARWLSTVFGHVLRWSQRWCDCCGVRSPHVQPSQRRVLRKVHLDFDGEHPTLSLHVSAIEKVSGMTISINADILWLFIRVW